MGVRGLTTYVNNNQDVFMKKYNLHDTNLIIDGHSICAQLYRLLNSFSAFGGEYDKFASYVKTFFKNLRKCNIVPYVIFDGCHEKKKLRTVFSRLKSKLGGTARLDPVTQDRLQIFPFLFRDVFKEVLNEMKINYTVCEFEADDDIASLARHMNCPVLSYDSDFFIYNVLYISFNTLEMKPKPFEENGVKLYAMECKIYKAQYLCEHFGGLNEELLPLLATLLGNDYVEKKVFRKFFSQLKLHKSKKKKNEQQRSIHTLFHWFQNETLDSAIEKILGRLKKHQKNKVFLTIKRSVEGYYNENCQSLKYFDITLNDVTPKSFLQMSDVEEKTDNSDNSVESTDESGNSDEDEEEEGSQEDEKAVTDDKLELIPPWFADKIRRRRIPYTYLNLYVHHLHVCNPQAEDFTEKDCFLCTLPILRYAFDILTDFSHEYCIYVCRENSGYKKLIVGKEYAIPRPLDVSFQEINDEQLKLCFQHFLNLKLPNLNLALIEMLPLNFRLFMISVLWWVSTCSVPITHVLSLIMSYITLEVIDEKTGTARGSYLFNNRNAKKLEELKKSPTSIQVADDELFLNKNKVKYEDCLIAASVILKHFEIDDSIRKRPKSYDIKKIHSFAQFQCILHQINSLNILCGAPFDTTRYSKCYNGVLIYNIALKLEIQADPMKFLDDYIKGATTVILFYKSICSIYQKLLEEMNLSNVQWSKRKRNRGKKVLQEDQSFFVKGFEADVII
ncbi:protein asteroid [Nymphalis io]|uniref:protein asteroid n=1 Tax=Inachis io TaxID=171585 RepID=UPI00216A7067|nr:protein asteroid [Nymphalis io]